MALGSNQPLTEMRTRNLPGGEGRPALKTDNLTAICEPTVWKMWKLRRLTTLWASTACYKDSFTFLNMNSDSNASYRRTCCFHVLVVRMPVSAHGPADSGLENCVQINRY
jgi:hypothetical protein